MIENSRQEESYAWEGAEDYKFRQDRAFQTGGESEAGRDDGFHDGQCHLQDACIV